MLELPEAITIADQINKTLRGKSIANVIAAYTSHTVKAANQSNDNLVSIRYIK